MTEKSFAKDFFLELMKDSQHLRASYQAERERWMSSLEVEGREETLFEFEMLLRGLDRYFNPHLLTSAGEPNLMAREFSGHLAVLRDTLNRGVHLSRLLIAPSAESGFLFRQYLEGQIADDRARAKLMSDLLEQRGPEQSLFLLRSGFVAVRGLVDALLKLDRAPYSVFNDLGVLLERELAHNKYFRPSVAFDFRPEYDRIGSVRVLDLLRKIEPERVRRLLAVAFLALFRLLRYLRFVPTPPTPAPRRTILVVALVRSEAMSLASFLQSDLAAKLVAAGGNPDMVERMKAAGATLSAALDGAKSLFAHDPPIAREALDAAREALSASCKVAVGQLASTLDPTLDAHELFDPAARAQGSVRLRRDLWVFKKLVERASSAVSAASGGPSATEATISVKHLKDFAGYFRDVSYQLLRYGDQDPFDKFLDVVSGIGGGFASSPARQRRLAEDLAHFERLLGKTLAAVERRKDLVTVAFDEPEAKAVLQKYLAA